MLRCSSGSWTGRRASMTWASGGHAGRGLRFLLCAIGRIPAWMQARRSVRRSRLTADEFSAAVAAVTSRLRRPHPPRDLPVRPRRRPRGHRRRGGRALRAAPQRGPPPPRQAGRRRLPRRPRRARRERRAPAGRPSATGPAPRRWPRVPAPAATTCSSPCSAGRWPCSPRGRRRPWPRRWARSTAATWPPSMAPGEGHRSFRVALHAVADALTAHGFAAHAEARGGSLAIIAEQCPFGDAAVQHPVICAVDRGIVKGMLASPLRRHRRPRPRRRAPRATTPASPPSSGP